MAAENMTANEALTGIFALLSAVVEQLDENNKATVRVSDADSTLVLLLSGMVETKGGEALGLAGEQLEKLSKGIIEVDKVGKETFENVSASIETLNKAINLINIDPKINNNMDLIINTLSKFNELSKYTLSLVNFIDSLKLTDPDKSLKEMMVIKNLFMSFNSIISLDIDKLIKSLNELKDNEDVGTAIGGFIKNIANSINEVEGISADAMKTLGLMLNGITLVALLNMLKLRFTFSKKSAENVAASIGIFLSTIISELSLVKPISTNTAKAINSLLDSITKIALLNMIKLMFTFNPISAILVAKSISKFLTIIIDKLSESKDLSKETAKAVGTLLNGLSAVSKLKMNELFWTFNGFMAKRVAKAIANFISIIAKEISKLLLEALANYKIIGLILDPLAKIGNSKEFKLLNLIKAFNPISAKLISSFFKKLVNGLPDGKETSDKLTAVSKILESLVKLNKTGVKALVYLGKHLDGEKGQNIADFLKNLCTAEIKKDNIEATVNLIKSFTLMVTYIVISVALLTLITAMTSWKDLLLSVAVVAFIVIGAKKLIKSLVDDLNDKNIKDASKMIYSITVMLVAMTASIAILTLIAASVEWTDMVLAAGIFWLEIVLVNKIIKNLTDKSIQESLGNATYTILAISVLLLSMSYSMKILTDVVADNKFKDIAISFIILSAFIGLSVWIINSLSDKNKDTGKATLTLLAMTAMLLIVSLIIAKVIIPIGEEAGPAALGALTVILLMTAMVGITWLINQIDVDDILIGLGIMAGIALLLLITSAITKELLIPIGEKVGDALLGAGAIVLILGAFGAIMFGIGKLVLNELVAIALVEGGIVLLGISGLLLLIGLMLKPFIETAKLAGENFEDVMAGSGAIAAIIGATGVIAGVLGAMSWAIPAIALGLVVLGSISLILDAIGETTITFINAALLVNNYSKDWFTEVGSKFTSMFKLLYTIFDAMVPNLKQTFLLGEALVTTKAMLPIIHSIKVIANAINESMKVVNGDTIKAFYDIIIGKGIEDTGSMLGSLYSIVESFNKFSKRSVKDAAIISAAMMPILTTLSKFIDIVNKVGTLTYISGFDKNGKPIFQKLPPSVFADAATNVSLGFGTFIQMLSDKFHEIDKNAVIAMGYIVSSMNPIMKTISKFVDIVNKVATLTIITGYDSNGKPKFEKVSPNVFTDAAIAVSNGFGKFLSELSTLFEKLKDIGAWTIRLIGNALKPVVDVLGKFVDIVIKVATMTYVDYYDSNGNPHYKKTDPEIFKTAADIVSTSFGTFLSNLAENMKKLDSSARIAINSVKDAILPVMSGISKFVDAIVKLSSAEVLDGYDADGKPIYRLISDTEYTNSAGTIVAAFDLFLTSLSDNLTSENFGKSLRKALESIAKSIGPVMDGIGKYADAIITLASGTITETLYENGKVVLDKDGNPVTVTKTINPDKYIQAAVILSVMFTSFVKTLITELKPLKKDADKVKDIIKDSINPIMDAVLKFSDALKPFLSLTDNKKDTTAKADNYLCFKPNFILTISNNIANAFTDFITTVVNSITNPDMLEKYTLAKETFPKVVSVMDAIEESANKLRNIINKLSDENNKVITTGAEVASLFFKALNAFTTGIDFNNGISYSELISNWNVLVNPYLELVLTGSDLFKQIISTLNNNEEKPYVDTVNGFNAALEAIVSKSISIYNRIKDIDFTSLIYMMNAFHSVTQELITISNYVMHSEDLTVGIDTFIKNMNTLTGSELTTQMIKSGNSITVYQTNLSKFTVQLKQTTTTVKFYITELDRAREALKALDEQIISKEKARNDALQSFADKVTNIANAVDKLKSSFDSLNENKILNQFDNIRKLIDAIQEPAETNVNVNVNSTNNTNSKYPINNRNNTQSSVNTLTGNQNGNTVVNNTNSLFGNNIKVEFNLQGWPLLVGHMNIVLK